MTNPHWTTKLTEDQKAAVRANPLGLNLGPDLHPQQLAENMAILGLAEAMRKIGMSTDV